MSSLPKTVTRQCCGCDLNPGLLHLSPLSYRATLSDMSESYLLGGIGDVASHGQYFSNLSVAVVVIVIVTVILVG